MIDRGEADDKIVAVLKGDHTYGHIKDISECPIQLIKRIKHYFLTYKNLPGEEVACHITDVYGREEAYEVIRRSQQDYKDYLNKA
jgi:inorganic pyrophosphatase